MHSRFGKKKAIWQEADFYGASDLIFGSHSKPLVYRASWMHGMGYSFSGILHKESFIHPDEVNLPIHLVNNDDSFHFLKNQKISSIAVGMPFIYAFEQNVKNAQRNLGDIFIPEHDITKTTENNFKEYIFLCKKYKCSKLLLMSNDFYKAKELEFDFKDIELVRGANVAENQSLKRIADIFLNSRRIFSNAFGSHLFYASMAGCEVILVDEITDNYSTKKNQQRISNYKNNISNNLYKKYIDNPFPLDELLSSIWVKGNKSEIKEYSEYMLGLNHKKSISEIKTLLTPRSNYETYKVSMSVLKKKLMRKLSVF